MGPLAQVMILLAFGNERATVRMGLTNGSGRASEWDLSAVVTCMLDRALATSN